MLRAVLVAIALAAGCADRPALPPPEELAGSAWGIAGYGDDLYWIEPEASAPLGLGLHRLRGGERTQLDRLEDWIPLEDGAAFIVPTEDGVLWGFSGAFTSCGWTRVVLADRPPFELPPGLHCQRLALDLHAGQALMTQQLDSFWQVERIAIAGGAVDPAFELYGIPDTPVVRTATHAYALIGDEAHGGGSLVGFERARTHYTDRLAGAIRAPGGLALDDTALSWIDNGAYGDPARVLARPLLHDQEPETIVTELERPAHALTAAGDRLWMIDGPPRSWDAHALTALRGTELTTYEVDYHPIALAGAGDRLGVVVLDDPEADYPRTRVWLQPLY